MDPCPDDWSRQGEFVIFDQCILSSTFAMVADTITVSLALLLLVVMSVMILAIHTPRPPINTYLICLTMFQQLLMIVRPGFNLIGFYSTELWVSLVVHGTAALMASVPIFFMYIELKIIIRGSLKTRGQSMVPTKWILITIAIVETLLFMTLPVLCHFLGAKASIAFWTPVIMVDFTAIPYFCYLGVSIYIKIHRLGDTPHKQASRKILISVIIGGLLGLFTGSAGIVAVIFDDLDWLLVRSCWLAAITFNQIIFTSLVGRPSKTRSTTSRPSTDRQEV